MKSIVAIILALASSVTIDITNVNLLKTCTVDDIDFDCNNGQINFGVENCQIDGSTFFKQIQNVQEKVVPTVRGPRNCT